MATLNGKKLTAAQLKALQKKWAKEDKAHWVRFYNAEAKRYQANIKRLRAKLKTSSIKATIKNIIAQNEKELNVLKKKLAAEKRRKV